MGCGQTKIWMNHRMIVILFPALGYWFSQDCSGGLRVTRLAAKILDKPWADSTVVNNNPSKLLKCTRVRQRTAMFISRRRQFVSHFSNQIVRVGREVDREICQYSVTYGTIMTVICFSGDANFMNHNSRDSLSPRSVHKARHFHFGKWHFLNLKNLVSNDWPMFPFFISNT